MRITISDFARMGLESEWGPDLSAAVDRALEEHLDRLEGEDLAPVPDFWTTVPRAGATVTAMIEPERELRIIEASLRRGCSVDDLAGEAIVHHLVGLDQRQAALTAV